MTGITFDQVVEKSGLPPATIQRMVLNGRLKISADDVYSLLAIVSESDSDFLRAEVKF